MTRRSQSGRSSVPKLLASVFAALLPARLAQALGVPVEPIAVLLGVFVLLIAGGRPAAASGRVAHLLWQGLQQPWEGQKAELARRNDIRACIRPIWSGVLVVPIVTALLLFQYFWGPQHPLLGLAAGVAAIAISDLQYFLLEMYLPAIRLRDTGLSRVLIGCMDDLGHLFGVSEGWITEFFCGRDRRDVQLRPPEARRAAPAVLVVSAVAAVMYLIVAVGNVGPAQVSSQKKQQTALAGRPTDSPHPARGVSHSEVSKPTAVLARSQLNRRRLLSEPFVAVGGGVSEDDARVTDPPSVAGGTAISETRAGRLGLAELRGSEAPPRGPGAPAGSGGTF